MPEPTPAAATDNASPETEAESGFLPRVKNLLEVVVSVATVVYALGYLSWAFYSWDHDFGLPPALEGQYLISGLVPAGLLVAFILTLYGLGWVRTKSHRPPTDKDRQRGKFLLVAGTWLIVAGFGTRWFNHPITGSVMIILGLLLHAISWWFSSNRTDQKFFYGATWYFTLMSPLVFVAFFHAFIVRVFPHLPSEFGGPAMQAVTLDLKKSELSSETLELLSARATGDAETVRTGRLRIVMPPGDFYLVLVEKDGKPATHVKMKADAVRAIGSVE
ncbi:MAG TPA: hypothetical protein VHO24_21230 [Opitutaceae bacterium]|nr:hypothetical protein [Opitutaceae bacterium]